MELQVIREKIYEIRGQKVMLDFDLAELYGVETRVFNQAIKRNIERFPEDFMFRLTKEEWRMSQIVISSEGDAENYDNQLDANSSQIVMSSEDRGTSQIVTSSGKARYRKKVALPYAFTEHGVSMLASVLRSEKAVQMSIAIVRAFVALKQYVIKQDGLTQQLRQIVERLDEHDVQLNSIYDAIENLLDEKVEQKAEEKKWADRERIGFKK
jgi:phage regulator Rha-like protein